MKRAWASIVCVSMCLFVGPISPSTAHAQAVNATLLGSVTDTSGATVAGAKVILTEMKTGVGRSATTNQSGNYEFPNLPPGQYEVSVEQSGFKTARRTGVEVQVNSDVRVNLVLEAGAVTEVMQVTADTPILQTDRSDVGTKIETKQIVDLPLGNNRNFQNLLNLVPGTTRAHREHSEFFNPQDSLSTEVNGQSRLANDLKIEGVDDNHRTGLLQIYIPPAEAIQTVDVTTSNYTAEFGRAGGAVTNVQLKSGTNTLHGSVFETNRVSALAAVPFFQDTSKTPKAASTYNYYGGTIGGSIIKNKLFFFGDILRIDDSRGKFDQFTLPTDARRVGNFTSERVIYDPYQTTDATHQTLVRDANGNPIPVDPGSRTAFPNNIIPDSRISPLAKKILALVPRALKNTATQNYQTTTRFLKHTTAFDTKFDFNRTDNDRFAFRFSRALESITDRPVFALAGGPKGGGFQGTGTQYTQSGALNHTHVFSPTLISEARIGVSHYHNIARNADYGSTASKDLGINGVNLDPFTSGLTSIDVQGGFSSPMIGYSASMPWDRAETNINFVSNWTKIHGNHTFKWGGDIRRLRDDLVQAQTFGPRGVFRFGNGTTSKPGNNLTGPGNNFAAFLLDAPTEVGRDISVISGSWRETELFFYGQDKWQFSPKLTLDAGLRWELYFPATPRHPGGYSNYDAANNTLVLAGIGSNPLDMGRAMSYRNFAPRLGLAYRLTEKAVFRGGFGISYEPFTNNQYAFNFPVRQTNSSTQVSGVFVPTWGDNGPIANMAFGFPAPAPVAIPSNGIIALPIPGPGVDKMLTHSNDAFNIIDKNFRNPYVESWNLAIQRSLFKNFVLEVAYVGNHGVRIPMTYNLNAAIAPGSTPTADTCPQRPLCKLYKRTASSDFLFKPTTSNYNALQVKFDHRWSSGFLMTTAWTYGKALAYRSDLGSDGGSPHFYLDTVNGATVQSFRRNYSVTSQDRRHIFVQSYIYELPFGKNKPWLNSGWAGWIAGGWQVSGIWTLMSGRPLRFVADGKSLNAPGTTQTPVQVALFRVVGGIGSDAWFDTSAFCQVGDPGCPIAGNGVMGNMAHYAFAGPRFFNIDASLFRRFAVRERVGLEFRADAFSLTNTPQFDLPSVDMTSSNFGRITNTIGGNRSLAFGAKITF